MCMTRRIAVAATLGLGLLAGAASAAENYTIGYSQFWGTNPFLVTMANGARKAIAEWKEKGVEIDMILTNGGDTDTTRQVADLEDLYAQGIDGLVLFPGDSIVVAEPPTSGCSRAAGTPSSSPTTMPAASRRPT